MTTNVSLIGRRTRAPRAPGKRGAKPAAGVKFALYKRGNPKYRNFHAILSEGTMAAAGLKPKDPVDLRFSADMRTCEIVRVTPDEPGVTLQPERHRAVARTRIIMDADTPEFETSDAEIVRTGGHAVVVKVPPKVRATLKSVLH